MRTTPLHPKTNPTASVLCALSLLAAAGTAQTQSSVTLYGIVDAAARYSSGLDAAYNGSAISHFVVNSGINNTSRFGLRGVEDLGGGLKAVFNLESGINVDTGAQANATKLFDSAATGPARRLGNGHLRPPDHRAGRHPRHRGSAGRALSQR